MCAVDLLYMISHLMIIHTANAHENHPTQIMQNPKYGEPSKQEDKDAERTIMNAFSNPS